MRKSIQILISLFDGVLHARLPTLDELRQRGVLTDDEFQGIERAVIERKSVVTFSRRGTTGMKRIGIGICLLALSLPAKVDAGELDDVFACIEAAEKLGQVALDARDATYEFRLFSRSTAKWRNAYCEVDLKVVYNLTVNGTRLIVDEFIGQQSYALNKSLEAKTEAAKKELNSRIATLEERQRLVTRNLKQPTTNHSSQESYISEGIQYALTGARPVRERPTDTQPTTNSDNAQPSTLEPAPASSEFQDTRGEQPSAPLIAAEESEMEAAPRVGPTGKPMRWVTVDRLNNRTCPSDTCGVINVLYFREGVESYEEKGGWSRITHYYPALCEQGRTPYVIQGDDRCSAANGFQGGNVARWVATRYLSDTRPTDPGAGAQGDYALIKNSNDYRIHKEIFAKSARKLIDMGRCSKKDFAEGIQWNISTNHEPQPIYFTYCGELTLVNQILLDTRTGRLFTRSGTTISN